MTYINYHFEFFFNFLSSIYTKKREREIANLTDETIEMTFDKNLFS